jgi:hypothetical protein
MWENFASLKMTQKEVFKSCKKFRAINTSLASSQKVCLVAIAVAVGGETGTRKQQGAAFFIALPGETLRVMHVGCGGGRCAYGSSIMQKINEVSQSKTLSLTPRNDLLFTRANILQS